MIELTRKKLKEIKDRCDKATVGKWYVKPTSIKGESLLVIDEYSYSKQFPTNDANFIAHSREDVPRLIAALEEALLWISCAESSIYVSTIGVERVAKIMDGSERK